MKSFMKAILLAVMITYSSQILSYVDHFQKAIDQHHHHLSSVAKAAKNRNIQSIEKLIEDHSNICTGGVKYKDYKEYLKAFAKGPCNPTIFIPGITASKLKVVIDCMEMKLYNFDLFSACGWSSCLNEGVGSPKSEYVFWIASPFDPMSFIQPTPSTRQCFTGIMKEHIDITNGKITHKKNPGIEIMTIGESPHSKGYEQSKCGFHSISNLIEFDILKIRRIQEMGYYANMEKAFEGAGFISGLTMQALPYNWRKGYAENRLHYKLNRTVTMLHEITGKKVNIVAHSMGNLNTLHNLWRMPQKQKDQMIGHYIAVAPPLLGSEQLTFALFGNYPGFALQFMRESQKEEQQANLDNIENSDQQVTDNVKSSWFSLGITPKMMEDALMLLPTIYQLLPRFFFKMHEDTPWMAALQERIKEETENLKHNPKNFINKFFPSSKEDCNPGFSQRNQNEKKKFDPDGEVDAKCKLGFKDFWNFGSVEGYEINPSTMGYLMDAYSFLPESRKAWNWARDARFDEMINPGVQTTLLYSTHIASQIKAYFKEDPRIRTMSQEFYYPWYTFGFGDGSVSTGSAISPFIKWAWEFENKKPDSKPVVMAELCGIKDTSESLFDKGTDHVGKNKYVGVSCNCREKDKVVDGAKCNHSNMVGDSGLVSFVLKSALSKNKGKVGHKYLKMDEQDLQNFVQGCTIFNYIEE